MQAVWKTAALTTGKTVLQYDLKTNSFPFRVRKHSRPLADLHGFCGEWCSRKSGGEKLILQDFLRAHRKETPVSTTAPSLEAPSSSHSQEKTHASH